MLHWGYISVDLMLHLPPSRRHRHVRESTFAKASLGTLPQLDVASVNNKRTAIVNFRKHLRAQCHASIYDCYVRHNARGGTVVPLQNGTSMYFPRAVILAIYADHPAAVECTVTGSSCPVCYTPKRRMASPTAASTELRNGTNMRKRRAILLNYAAVRDPPGASERAQKRARQQGISLGDLSVWSVESAAERCVIDTPAGPVRATADDWVLGPDRKKDNVHQNTPQVPPDFHTPRYFAVRPLHVTSKYFM